MAIVRRIIGLYPAVCVMMATGLAFLVYSVDVTYNRTNRELTHEIPSASRIHTGQVPGPSGMLRRDIGLDHQQRDVHVYDDVSVLENKIVGDAHDDVTSDDTASAQSVPVSRQQPGGPLDDTTQRVEESKDGLPTVYVITPTHASLTQEPELTHLCHTLMHVRNVHWIVVEDSADKTSLVIDLLHDCRAPTLTVTHLTALTPNGTRHRGVAQRNEGLDWVRGNKAPPLEDLERGADGGLYFADDDNTYDVRLFEAVRRTRNASVWLVGLVGGSLYEGPTCYLGQVTGWRTNWVGKRRFPLDMAGFALGVDFVRRQAPVHFSHDATVGYLEDAFLKSNNLTVDQLTAGTDPSCSKVLVWHTKTRKPAVKPPKNYTITGKLIQ